MYDSIVKIQGGLGNQMFQYSVAKWLESKGKNVALDISHYSKNFDGPVDPIHNGYEMESIFGLSANYADYSEVCKVADIKRDYFSRARRKFLFLKSTHIQQERICKDELYVPDLISKSPAYIDGYWCTFKYADCIDS